MKMIAIFCLLLAGCGFESGDINNNHGYGFSYDIQGISGTKVRYKPLINDGEAGSDIGWYEAMFSFSQTCTGLSATGPFIILVPVGSLMHDGQRASGLYYWGPSLIVLEVSEINGLALLHENVHYLLDKNGYQREKNAAHDSPLFAACS